MSVSGDHTGRARTAAEWFAHLQRDEVSSENWATFLEWLEASPQNQVEFRRVEQLWILLGEVVRNERMAEESRQILAREAPSVKPRARFHISLALAASLVLVVFAGLWAGGLSAIQEVRTAVGEQKSLTLADGSRVTVNANTSLRIDYRLGRRNITLEQGEALFEVAHDQSHPFTVRTTQALVTAVGTEFAVAQYGNRIHVDVLEGRVLAKAENGSRSRSPPVMLAAGEAGQLSDGDTTWTRSQADVARIRKWQAKRLEFRQATLEAIVAEFNKNSDVQIVLGDHHVAALRVSGIVRLGHTESLLSALLKLYPIEAQTDSNKIVLRYSHLPEIGHVKSTQHESN